MDISRHLAALKKYGLKLAAFEGVQSIGIGFKEVGGKRTDQVAIVVSVEHKWSAGVLSSDELIPKMVEDVLTDVREVGTLKAQAFITKERPCRAGWSCGHKDITAGTLGLWVKRGTSDEWHILSNNHVLANTNAGAVGDTILQPGPHDNGTLGDRIAVLTEFVTINFPDAPIPGGCKFWNAAAKTLNATASFAGRKHRMEVSLPGRITQPDPNLVDAAVARVVDPKFVDTRIGPPAIVPAGIRDLALGDRVLKFGRTTEETSGYVDQVAVTSKVSYGGTKVATFTDQINIKADSGEFSAGGDSGSIILTSDFYIGGLLFAGGTGTTIANKISHVVSFLGIRLE